MGEHRLLPIRWMAPETIKYTSQKFSSASDVWAYGVTIWEIFTMGQRPYFNLSNQDVLIKVPEGLTLEAPENCPQAIKNVMKLCWAFEIDNRCSFEDIVQLLESEQPKKQLDNPTYDPDLLNPNTIYETPRRKSSKNSGNSYIEVVLQ